MPLFISRKMPALRGLSAVATLAIFAFNPLRGQGTPPSAPPALYLFSVLNNNAPIGPLTYTSVSGTTLTPLTKAGGGNIVPPTPQMRDARFLHVGSKYYYSFTHGGGPSQAIGLVESPDLQNWTPVTTPNWSSLFRGKENAIWNGTWWNDDGAYYMFFGVCQRLVPTCRPYYVPFNPASATFGVPQPISFTTKDPHTYNIVMSIFPSAGSNWALLQTLDQKGNSIVALASFTSLTSPWKTNWSMLGGQPMYRESGAAVVLPNHYPRVYYVRNSGGEVFYTTANGINPSKAKWSAPQAIPPFAPASLPADWIDVVPISDAQTLQLIAAIRAAKPAPRP